MHPRLAVGAHAFQKILQSLRIVCREEAGTDLFSNFPGLDCLYIQSPAWSLLISGLCRALPQHIVPDFLGLGTHCGQCGELTVKEFVGVGFFVILK